MQPLVKERALVPPESHLQSQFRTFRAAANTCQREGDRKSMEGSRGGFESVTCWKVRQLCGRGHVERLYTWPCHTGALAANVNMLICTPCQSTALNRSWLEFSVLLIHIKMSPFYLQKCRLCWLNRGWLLWYFELAVCLLRFQPILTALTGPEHASAIKYVQI